MSTWSDWRVKVAAIVAGKPILDLQKKDAGGYGLAPDYLSFRNVYWGQQQPVNYRILWKMFLEIPEVYAALKVIADHIVGDGWEIESDTELHKKQVTDMLDKNNWTAQLKDIVFSQSIFGDAYLELVRAGGTAYYMGSAVGYDGLPFEKSVSELKKRLDFLQNSPEDKLITDFVDDNAGKLEGEDFRGIIKEKLERKQVGAGRVQQFYTRDASTIRIDYNEHGEAIKYIQRVLHRRVDYFPDEMIHLPINVIGGRVYGHSPLSSLIRTARIKYDAEEYSADWLRRNGIPRMLYTVINYSKEQLQRFQDNLQAMQYNQDVVVTAPNKDAVDVKMVAPKSVDMQWAEFLNYLQEQIFISLQVPPELVGKSANANRSMADVNMDMFYKMIKCRKRELEEQLNRKFFTSEIIGFSDVKFKFKSENIREELKEVQKVQLLSTIPYFTPDEVRDQYGMKPLTSAQKKEIEEHKEMTAPKFQSKQPGVQVPGASQEKEKNSERFRAEAAQEKRSMKSIDYVPEKLVRIRQGSISTREKYPPHPATLNVENTPETRNPFGAFVENEEEDRQRVTAFDQVRDAEVREVQTNERPFDLNEDRPFPKDKTEFVETPSKAPRVQEKYPKHKPARPKAEKERLVDPERDEVNDAGQRVWANTDPDGQAISSTPEERKKGKVNKEVDGMGLKAKFYDGTNQLDEGDF